MHPKGPAMYISLNLAKIYRKVVGIFNAAQLSKADTKIELWKHT
jgi:hypothetical protein